MTMHVDRITGGLSFESRADLPAEIDIAPERLLGTRFVLPQEVDFHIILSRHATEQDFDIVVPALRSCDIYLTEFAEPELHAMQFAQEISKGNKSVYDRYKQLIKKGDPDDINQWCDAMFDCVYRYRPRIALFDPPIGHQAYDSIDSFAKKFAELGEDEPLDHLTVSSYDEILNRDKWCLQNMKGIVDYLLPYKKGIRRQVLITRGTYHTGLARTIEQVCETDHVRAMGSAVVASTIVLQSGGEAMLNYFYTQRLTKNN